MSSLPDIESPEKGSNMDSPYSSAHSQMSSYNEMNSIYSNRQIASLSYSGLNPDVIHSYMSSSSTVKVEIHDIDNDQMSHPTAYALKKCKRLVLTPYNRLLAFIGWRSLGKDSVNSGSCVWKLINFIYTFFIIIFLLFSYAYQALHCSGKLNIHLDTQIIGTAMPITTANISTTLMHHHEKRIVPMRTSPAANNTVVIFNDQCYHIVSTYIIPCFFHLLAFLLGFIQFRLRENEHLYFIMEKVFLQADPFQSRGVTQNRIIRNSRMIIWTGALWVILTVVLQVLFLLAFGWDYDFLAKANLIEGYTTSILLTIFEVIGSIIYSCVFMAVMVNYILQCELLIFNIQTISTQLREKSVDIKAAMQNILSVRESISRLNGPLARMTALCIMTLAELTVIGTCLLILNKILSWKIWLYRITFPVVWFISMFVPLVQAARVTKYGEKLRQISFEMRVFGHKKNSQLDLDSFILFISNASLRTKLFSVPMKPALLISILCLLVFTLIILFQTGIIGGDEIYF